MSTKLSKKQWDALNNADLRLEGIKGVVGCPIQFSYKGKSMNGICISVHEYPTPGLELGSHFYTVSTFVKK